MSLTPYQGVCPTCRHDHGRDAITEGTAVLDYMRANTTSYADLVTGIMRADKERDAARAEVARLKGLLRELMGCIDIYDGHGNPGCPDRAQTYFVMQRVDAALAETPAAKEVK